MVKKLRQHWNGQLTKRQKLVVLPVMIVIGTAVVLWAIMSVVTQSQANQDAQRGIGADGFQAYQESDADLGIGKVIGKSDVVSALGNKAKSVSDASVSKVFNYNGDRGQTVTYGFNRSDGNQASLYADVLVFKNQSALDDANIFGNTKKTGDVQGHPAYFMMAQTIGSSREYRLMVVDGLKAYKFVIDQPLGNITINEVSAVASLVALAQKAHFVI